MAIQTKEQLESVLTLVADGLPQPLRWHSASSPLAGLRQGWTSTSNQTVALYEGAAVRYFEIARHYLEELVNNDDTTREYHPVQEFGTRQHDRYRLPEDIQQLSLHQALYWVEQGLFTAEKYLQQVLQASDLNTPLLPHHYASPLREEAFQRYKAAQFMLDRMMQEVVRPKDTIRKTAAGIY